jgi:glycosyltransferase involved in cell wall biosynthesis
MNCFNGKKYLHQSIKSILAQSYHSWEIIFIDNKSNDSSDKIFKSYKDKRFHYYCVEKQTSLYEARNYALSKCNGELIAFLDVDDVWFSKKLETQVNLFNDKFVGLSCGNFIILNEERNNNISLKPRYHLLPNGNVLNELLDDNFIHFSSLLIRKKALSDLDYLFNPRFNIIGDFDLILRLCSKWKLISIQQPITYYRFHQNNYGYKKITLLSDDYNYLIKEIKDNKKYKKLSNFIKFKYKVKLYNVLRLLYNGEKVKVLSQIKSLKTIHKLKALTAIFLPNKLIKILIDSK